MYIIEFDFLSPWKKIIIIIISNLNNLLIRNIFIYLLTFVWKLCACNNGTVFFNKVLTNTIDKFSMK